MLLFANDTSPLPHNICIGKPGTKDKLAGESLKMAADPTFLKNNYFLNSEDILFKGTKLVLQGQSDLLEFTAPAEAGDYPYLCTFPGHAVMMFGVMHVK
jgi:azurin